MVTVKADSPSPVCQRQRQSRRSLLEGGLAVAKKKAAAKKAVKKVAKKAVKKAAKKAPKKAAKKKTAAPPAP